VLQEYEDVRSLKSLIQRHLKFTGSQVARHILLNWDKERVKFVKVGTNLQHSDTPLLSCCALHACASLQKSSWLQLCALPCISACCRGEPADVCMGCSHKQLSGHLLVVAGSTFAQ
jgi:hypothetical protein